MKITTQLFSLAIVGAVFGISTPSFAADWTVPAYISCKDAFNSASSFKSGYKANSGGSTVIVCPLTKLVSGTNPVKNVYARIKRASANSVDARCNLNIYTSYGTSHYGSYKYSAKHTNNQSLNIPIPSQSGTTTGYGMVTCIMQPGDVFYGLRYIQSY